MVIIMQLFMQGAFFSMIVFSVLLCDDLYCHSSQLPPPLSKEKKKKRIHNVHIWTQGFLSRNIPIIQLRPDPSLKLWRKATVNSTRCSGRVLLYITHTKQKETDYDVYITQNRDTSLGTLHSCSLCLAGYDEAITTAVIHRSIQRKLVL